ncbi:MAG: flagellin [Pseudomonadota bacterium]
MTNTFATNAASNSAVSYLDRNSRMQSSSIAKLSSGSRIVKASDDAASLAVGTKLKADVTALKQASTNASQAASMLQIADGAMSRISDTLLRMKSLATQSLSDVLSDTERGYLDKEFQALVTQIDYITSSTKFNGIAVVSGAMGTGFDTYANDFGAAGVAAADVKVRATGGLADNDAFKVVYDKANGLMTATNNTSKEAQTVKVASSATHTGTVDFDALGVALDFDNFDLTTKLVGGDDTFAVNWADAAGQGAATFQVGENAANDTVTVHLADVDSTALGVNGQAITSAAAAVTASGTIDTAMQTLNTERANIGASMSRLEAIGENLATTIENLDAARSVLMDVDVAEEMTKFTTNQVMTQAATAMLAQANQLPQNLMRLLQ